MDISILHIVISAITILISIFGLIMNYRSQSNSQQKEQMKEQRDNTKDTEEQFRELSGLDKRIALLEQSRDSELKTLDRILDKITKMEDKL